MKILAATPVPVMERIDFMNVVIIVAKKIMKLRIIIILYTLLVVSTM